MNKDDNEPVLLWGCGADLIFDIDLNVAILIFGHRIVTLVAENLIVAEPFLCIRGLLLFICLQFKNYWKFNIFFPEEGIICNPWVPRDFCSSWWIEYVAIKTKIWLRISSVESRYEPLYTYFLYTLYNDISFIFIYVKNIKKSSQMLRTKPYLYPVISSNFYHV